MAEVWSISLPTDKRKSKPVPSPGIVSMCDLIRYSLSKESWVFPRLVIKYFFDSAMA